MGLTFKQVTTEAVTGGGTSEPVTYGSNNTAGSFLICHALTNNVAATLTVTDPTNGSWTQLGNFVNDTGNKSGVFIILSNTASSALTVTAHASISSVIAIFAAEYTGQAVSNPIDVTLGLKSLSGTSFSIGPIQTQYTNETILVIGRTITASGTWSTTDGSTFRPSATGAPFLSDRGVSASGNYTGTYAITSGGDVTSMIVGVKSTTSIFSPVSGSWLQANRDFANKRGIRGN